MRTFIIGLIILILAAGASTPWLINRGHTLEANEMHWGTVIRPFSLQTPAVGAAAYDWKANVHGADLLSAVFGRLTDHRIAYDKVRHGIALTTAVLEFDFPDVKSLAIDELSPLLSKRAS